MTAVIIGGGVNWSTRVTGVGFTEGALIPSMVKHGEDTDLRHLRSAMIALHRGIMGSAGGVDLPQLQTWEVRITTLDTCVCSSASHSYKINFNPQKSIALKAYLRCSNSYIKCFIVLGRRSNSQLKCNNKESKHQPYNTGSIMRKCHVPTFIEQSTCTAQTVRVTGGLKAQTVIICSSLLAAILHHLEYTSENPESMLQDTLSAIYTRQRISHWHTS